MKLELNDRAIEKIKIADFEFTYINDNKTKSRDRIHIPFKVAKKSTLKGLNLIVHKSTSRILLEPPLITLDQELTKRNYVDR